MIHDLRRQGLGIAAIAGRPVSTARPCASISTRAAGRPVRVRQPRPQLLEPYEDYLRGRFAAFPGLSGRRLRREIAERGYTGGYTAVTDFLREARPAQAGFELRFETPPGRQAQADFAHFKAVFDDEPGHVRTVWLFSMVLAHSRWLWGRFCAGQNLQTVLRCHIAALQAMGGVPAEIPLRPHVVGEDPDGTVTYNPALVDRTSINSAPGAARSRCLNGQVKPRACPWRRVPWRGACASTRAPRRCSARFSRGQ